MLCSKNCHVIFYFAELVFVYTLILTPKVFAFEQTQKQRIIFLILLFEPIGNSASAFKLRCSLTCYWALNHNNEIYAKIYHKLSFSRLLMIDMGVDVDTISYFVYTFFSYFIWKWNIFFYVFNIMECKLEFQWNCEEKNSFSLIVFNASL